MYPDFAYSVNMQLILAIAAFITNFAIVYSIAGLMLFVHGETANVFQKSIFAFLIGTVLNTGLSYAVYFISGMYLSPTAYALVVNPNPLFALLYYVIGVKVLELPPIRSIRLMGHVYLYYMLLKSLGRILALLFFVQPAERYNYLLDTYKNFAMLAVFLFISFIVKVILRRNKQTIMLRDNIFINTKKELSLYFIKASLIYFLMVCGALLFSGTLLINIIIFLILLLIFSLSVLWDMYISVKNDVPKKDAHIDSLINEIRSGQINEAKMLREKANENPALISILMSKFDYADSMNINISATFHTRIDNLYIDNTDICIVVACLLDNAIEAAANSGFKRVSFAVEPIHERGKLIIISNSTSVSIDTNKIISQGLTTKSVHHGRGLSTISKIISKHGNCTFRLSCYNYEVSAYFEVIYPHKGAERE